MKKILLGLALGLTFAGMQASLFSDEVSKCMSTGKSLDECRQLEREGKLQPALQLGTVSSPAQSSKLSTGIKAQLIKPQPISQNPTSNYLVGY